MDISSQPTEIDYNRIYSLYSSENYILKELDYADYSRGFLDILKELRDAKDTTPYVQMSEKDFTNIVDKIKKSGYVHTILVAVNKKETDPTKAIVAAGTVFVEPKFIHNGGNVAHVEDVAVLPDHLSSEIGNNLVYALKDIGIGNDCYKIILDCQDNRADFFTQVGFQKKKVQMAHYISEQDKSDYSKRIQEGKLNLSN